MIDFDRLGKLLPGLAAELPELHRQYVAAGGAGGVGAFLADLNRHHILTDDHLRALLQTPAFLDFVAHDDTHELLGELGRGAMGVVHLARDPGLDRVVALKQLDPKVRNDAEMSWRFRREARITARLQHPGIVPVHHLEVDADGGVAYSMKKVGGETLADYVAECRRQLDGSGRLDDTHALQMRLEVFLEVCDAIAYAHEQGVIHRDLKPANIMVGQFGEVLVMDWGVARLIGSANRELAATDAFDDGAAEATRAGTAIGTPVYMSPEQAEGRNEALDGRSDQYALGLILHEMLGLRRAIVAKNAMAALAKALDGMIEPLRPYHRAAPIPRELAAIVRKATAYDRDERYPSVAAFAEDIRRYVRDEAVLAQPDTPMQRVGRLVSRHRTATAMLVAGLVVAMLGLALVGTVASFAVLEANRAAARERADRIDAIREVVDAEALALENELAEFEALLSGLATAAEVALTNPPRAELAYFVSADFDAEVVPGLATSKTYPDPVSVAHSDITFAAGVDPASLGPRAKQLASLHPTLLKTMLRSGGESLWRSPSAGHAKAVMDGLPFVWTYVAVEEGILVGQPGVGGEIDDYDMRTTGWYTVARHAEGPVWNALELDESGLGLLLTCSRPLFDDGRVLGVAAVDIPFSRVIAEHLDPPGLAGEAVLADADGRVVVRGTQRQLSEHLEAYQPAPFERAGDLGKAGAGAVELADGTLLVWRRLRRLDWTYVVVGDAEVLLGQ